MAVKNTLMGGTDAVDGQIITALNYNDTNNEIYKYFPLIKSSTGSAITIAPNTLSGTVTLSGFAVADVDNGGGSGNQSHTIQLQAYTASSGTVNIGGSVGFTSNATSVSTSSNVSVGTISTGINNSGTITIVGNVTNSGARIATCRGILIYAFSKVRS